MRPKMGYRPARRGGASSRQHRARRCCASIPESRRLHPRSRIRTPPDSGRAVQVVERSSVIEPLALAVVPGLLAMAPSKFRSHRTVRMFHSYTNQRARRTGLPIHSSEARQPSAIHVPGFSPKPHCPTRHSLRLTVPSRTPRRRRKYRDARWTARRTRSWLSAPSAASGPNRRPRCCSGNS